MQITIQKCSLDVQLMYIRRTMMSCQCTNAMNGHHMAQVGAKQCPFIEHNPLLQAWLYIYQRYHQAYALAYIPT